jgi:hypothetical protein
VVSEEKIFRNQPFQKQEWPVVAMFVNDLVGNIYGRLFVKIAHFVPIH